MTGDELNKDMVVKAREEEMNEFRIHGVYIKVPLKECWDTTGQGPIGTKWIDINKGDKLHPEYRSRLVAQEIKMDKRNDLFAATPPIEALRCLLAAAAYDYGVGIKGIKLGLLRREACILPCRGPQGGVCEAP